MAKREETLAKNTLIFAIGNLGSKLIQIILVPFYARIMTSEQYGTVDILQAMVALLLPIGALAIYESVFRYAMDSDYDKTAVLSVGMVVTVLGTAAMCVAGCFLQRIVTPAYVWLVIVNTAVNAFWTAISQYTKAIGRSVLYAIGNIVMTALALVLNVMFLAGFRLGIEGYMLGYILANFLSTVFLILCLRSDFRLSLQKVTRGLTKEMLIFALPLLLNGICWWLSSFTSRIMITYLMDASANGQYAAASKLPQLLSVIVTIFYQAWQMSANEEFKSKDVVSFFSQTYEQTSACTFVLGSVMILLCRPINTIFLGENYVDAWIMVPPLVMMTVFFSFCQFLISIYSANKKTSMAFVTNLVCVVANIVLNWLMIPVWGVMGAAIACAISYFILWIVRILDTGRIVRIQYHTGRIVLAVLILLGQSVLICMDGDALLTYGLSTAGLVVLIVLYRKTLWSLLTFCLGLLGKLLLRRKRS